MEAVAKVLDRESWVPIRAIVERAGCGKIRTVRSALSQLREEGRVVMGGKKHSPVYQLATEESEMAA